MSGTTSISQTRKKNVRRENKKEITFSTFNIERVFALYGSPNIIHTYLILLDTATFAYTMILLSLTLFPRQSRLDGFMLVQTKKMHGNL